MQHTTIILYIYLMGLVKSEDIHYKLEEINNVLRKKYATERPERGMNWRTY